MRQQRVPGERRIVLVGDFSVAALQLDLIKRERRVGGLTPERDPRLVERSMVGAEVVLTNDVEEVVGDHEERILQRARPEGDSARAQGQRCVPLWPEERAIEET